MQLRIAHVTTVPSTLRAFLAGQLRSIVKMGFEVSVVSSGGPELEQFGLSEGVEVCGIEMTRRMTPVRDLVALGALVSYFRHRSPSVVHAHTPKGGLLGMMAAAIVGTPVRIYHIHGLPMLAATGVQRMLLRTTETIACRLAHRVIVVSHSVRDAVVQERICEPDKLRVLLAGSINGVDAGQRFNPAALHPGTGADTRARLQIPQTARVVGFVGRIVRDKGIGELAQAWRTLRAAMPDVHLLIVGEREDREPLNEIAPLLDDTRVHFTGQDWNTPPLYAAMDVLVLPTYREGLPTVLLEGAAMGLPVVATKVPGCVDAVRDGGTGTLVPPRDPVALASAIRMYLENPPLRQRHGRQGRLRVLAEFQPEAMWQSVYAEYCQLLRDRGIAAPERSEPPILVQQTPPALRSLLSKAR